MPTKKARDLNRDEQQELDDLRKTRMARVEQKLHEDMLKQAPGNAIYWTAVVLGSFALNLLLGSPAFGVLAWNLASHDVHTSYAAAYGDAFLAIGLGLFNGLAALVGAIAAALRKPPAAPKNEERGRTRDRPR